MANTGKRKTTNTGAVKTVDMTRGTGKTIRAAERGVIDNIWGVCLIVVGIFIFAAVRFNSAGTLGNGLGNILKGVFGQVGMILPFYLIIFGILLLINKNMHISLLTGSLGGLIVLMMCLINSGRFIPKGGLPVDAQAFYETGKTLESGGFFGMVIGSIVVKYLGKVGLYGIAIAVILVAALLIINIPVSQMLSFFGQKNRARMDKQKVVREERRKLLEEREKERQKEAEVRRKERERREKEARRERDYIYRNGGAVEMSMTELLTQNGAQIFGTKRNSKDKVDSEDMIDFFNYTRRPDEPVYGDDRARHFVDLLENNFSSGSGRKRRVSSSQPSQPATQRATRGIAINPYDEVPSGSSGYGLNEAPKRVINSGPAEMDWSVDLFDEQPVKEEKKPKVKPKADVTEEPPMPSTEAQALMNELNPETSEQPKKEKVKEPPKEIVINKTTKKTGNYKKPPISLLKAKDKSQDHRMSNAVLEEKAQELEDTLRSFNVSARVIGVTQGPTVTRYEVQPDVGVKASRIVNLSDDIALNLRAKNIRIQAPIPGKAAVGIEVENDVVNMITFREMVESKEFKEMNSKIAFVLGRDIAGKAIVADLSKMPHLLIAGATGSGKSVCINGIIASFLYNATPDEVKLVLIDPKKVELGNYEGIPHLLTPVVTEPTEAAASLNWAVAEMNDRYQKFADAKVKNLAEYNEYVKRMNEEGNEEDPENPLTPLPRIVIIIDELHDLMLAAKSQVETSIARITALARAAGMHLIVATQRPSVDVITGVIKANIPSRIGLRVSSQVDSRTILDSGGAEKLAGNGDMLFNPTGAIAPIRIQGCYIDTEEINNIIAFVKSQAEATYDDNVGEIIKRGNIQTAGSKEKDKDSKNDKLLKEVIEYFFEKGEASTSKIQRRFGVGYNKAADIMDVLENMGFVGPAQGSKARPVLWTEEDYANWNNSDDYDEDEYA